jgi:hypothetical protein
MLSRIHQLSVRLFVCIVLPLCALACGPHYEQRVFEVHLINQSDTTLSVGLVKKGQPLEDGWVAPEQTAILATPLADKHWGTQVKPGQSIVLGPKTGAFAEGSHAAVRVYAGTPTIEETVGYAQTDPDRLDINLWPGRCKYTIKRANRRLVGVREED